ncbi:MAG: hypothetical protein KJP21_03140 [Bacteroidia bacterium]|nr:hypothetical protein [Bacteroidia bacterium]NNJ56842.1 hypothetical protein [Bacteroidia bacterium]
MQSKDIIEVLESDDAKTFIMNHINEDFTRLSLKFSGKTSFNITVCLQLMTLYIKAKIKIPLFSEQLLALDKRSFEQSSSQRIAKFKATVLKGNSLLDITGGLGVDSIFLSQAFQKIDVIERNQQLHELALFNIRKLELNNINRFCGDGSSYIKPGYDWIYIDPDRRKGSSRSVVLENLEPNILELLPQLKTATNQVYIKLSPLFDIDEVWRIFDQLNTVYILAEKGEIKEVGVCLDFRNNATNKSLVLVDVASGFNYTSNAQKRVNIEFDSNVENRYLLIPNALLIKSRLSDEYLTGYSVTKHNSFHYYFSPEKLMIEGVRTFEILGHFSISAKELVNELKKLKIEKLNIVVKGLSDQPELWHKKLKTLDGGEYYLFILKSKKKESILCKLIS